MEVPRDFDLCEPTLQALRSLGSKGTVEQISKAVIRLMQLPEEVTEQLRWSGPETELDYQLGWARSILETCGLAADLKNGVWALTEKGKWHPPIDHEGIKKAYMERVKAESDDSDESLERLLPDSLEDELWYAMAAKAFRVEEEDEVDAIYDNK